ncbi:hypothetical protein GCM10027589_40290 [Actinocorallia lasiicapitis]
MRGPTNAPDGPRTFLSQTAAFRSLQGELLAWLFLHPEGEFSLVELARRFEVSAATVTREADRFLASGLISERRAGNLRMIRAELASPVAGPLEALLAVTFGPTAVLPELLAEVEGVEEAYFSDDGMAVLLAATVVMDRIGVDARRALGV